MVLEQWNATTSMWDAQADLPEINASLVQPDVSTIKRVTTATGSIARLIPQTKMFPEPIEFLFKYQTTLKDRIKAYMNNASYLRITMHTGEEFLGYFIRLNSTWRVFAGTEQKYILAATFDVISSSSSSSSSRSSSSSSISSSSSSLSSSSSSRSSSSSSSSAAE